MVTVRSTESYVAKRIANIRLTKYNYIETSYMMDKKS